MVGSAVGVLLLAGMGYWNALRVAEHDMDAGRREFREEVAALRAQRFRRPSLLLPEASGDASEVYASVRASLGEASVGDLDVLESRDWESPTAEQAAAGAKAAAQIATILQGMEPAFHRPYTCSVPAELGSSPLLYGSGRCGSARDLARRGLTCAREVRRQGRVEETAALLAATWLFTQDATLGASRCDVGRARHLEADIQAALRDLLERESMPPAALADLAQRLDALNRGRRRLAESWRLDRCDLLGVLSEDSLWGNPQGRMWMFSSEVQNLWSIRVARSRALRGVRSLPTELTDDCASKILERRYADALGGFWNEDTGPLRDNFMHDTRRGLEVERAAFAGMAALRLAVAVARFEADHGAWPTAEGDLVPAYMAELPTSTLDPGGLHFGGNRAWSRGPDGDDDGGRPMNDPDRWSGDGDIVVQVKGHH